LHHPSSEHLLINKEQTCLIRQLVYQHTGVVCQAVAVDSETTHIPRGHIVNQAIRLRIDPFVLLGDQTGGDETVFPVSLHVESGDAFGAGV